MKVKSTRKIEVWKERPNGANPWTARYGMREGWGATREAAIASLRSWLDYDKEIETSKETVEVDW